MNERPILFTGAMVRAILDGRKTQTRRVIKRHSLRFKSAKMPFAQSWPGNGHWDGTEHSPQPNEVAKLCPYGVPGDRLWVRETHCWLDEHVDGVKREDPVVVGYPADGQVWKFEPHGHRLPFHDLKDFGNYRLRPSLHMPRWASRITLEITGVRVQRVQDIAVIDIEREGLSNKDTIRPGHRISDSELVANFVRLWDYINSKRGFGWDVDPWVWVVEFKEARR